MLLTLVEIFNWTGSTTTSRNFREGERSSIHVFKIGKVLAKSDADSIHIQALCYRSTNPTTTEPYEIDIKINSESNIISSECSCAAGKGEKFKHVMATLLRLYQYDGVLPDLSCTDTSYSWKEAKKVTEKVYKAIPLKYHICPPKLDKFTSESSLQNYLNSIREDYTINNSIDEPVSSYHLELVQKLAPSSSFAKKLTGRHSPILPQSELDLISNPDKESIKHIFLHQDSSLMEHVKNLTIDNIQQCCQNTLNNFNGDFIQICLETKVWFARWQDERLYRITGSICYSVYTYSKNKKANWESKSEKIFSLNSYKTIAMDYGNKTEGEARQAFSKENPNLRIVETGLIVSKQNPWLAYSPDGVIFMSNKICGLLEIKCPIAGKFGDIDATIESACSDFLTVIGENITVKKKTQIFWSNTDGNGCVKY